VNTSYSYDSVSHLLSVLHQAGTNVLDGASYTYDPAGNRTSKTNYLNGTTSNYTYDPLYELKQVTQGGSTTESYSYDAVGNRLSSVDVPLYNYNSSNELNSNSLGSYTYDANGNSLTDSSGKSYSWDFENRLTQGVNPGVGTTTFRYDPFGRRVQKSGPLGTTNYLYDGARPIDELDSSGSVLAKYTHSPEVDDPLSMLRGGATSYYQNDGIGSITSLSNQTAALASTYTFDSFGKLAAASTGTITNPFRYTAREFDIETGIYYNRARYFDPGSGRFISEDPLRFGGDGPNFYAYVNNDPIDFTDPLGLKCCDVPTHPPGVSIEANRHKQSPTAIDGGSTLWASGAAHGTTRTGMVNIIPNMTILETSTQGQPRVPCTSRSGSPCVALDGQNKGEWQTILTETGGGSGRMGTRRRSKDRLWRDGNGATTVARSPTLRWVQRLSPAHHSRYRQTVAGLFLSNGDESR
jgi:RHS repeat-associated protein